MVYCGATTIPVLNVYIRNKESPLNVTSPLQDLEGGEAHFYYWYNSSLSAVGAWRAIEISNNITFR